MYQHSSLQGNKKLKTAQGSEIGLGFKQCGTRDIQSFRTKSHLYLLTILLHLGRAYRGTIKGTGLILFKKQHFCVAFVEVSEVFVSIV